MLSRATTPYRRHRALAPSSLSGETFGVLINLSGRRRFTSQRLVLYAVLASLGHEAAVDTACEALRQFSDAHTALVKGNDELPGVFCEELEQAYFGTGQGERQIREFISLAERALATLSTASSQAPVLLDQLVRSATPILAVLNSITQIYEELAKRYARQVKKQLHGIMTDIESIAKQARMVSFNAQIVAARAGVAGREFSVVASELSNITGEIDTLVRQALHNSSA